MVTAMTPDDPRHGTKVGYRAGGCRMQCCRDAEARYERIRIYQLDRGLTRTCDPAGSRRRVQALLVMGWTHQHIAEAGGMKAGQNVQYAIREGRRFVYTSTRDKIAAAYSQLSMTYGPSTQGRKLALGRGMLPPLAWDEDTIDNPNSHPHYADFDADLVDDVLVQRALNGHRVHTNKAEKAEIVRLWIAAERPIGELDRIQGWNIHRDRRAA